MQQSFSWLWSILISTLVVALLLTLLVYFDLQAPVIGFFGWLQHSGLWAPLIFIGIYIFLVIFLIPSVLFTLGAGFLFGPFFGTASVVLASTLGAISAFLISRYLFSDGVRSYLRSHRKLKFVNDEFVHEGWKVILLTRLVPFFPLKLSNYLFGSTNFSIADFITGTFLGIIPNTFLVVYLGSFAADLSELTAGDMLKVQDVWGFYALALVLLLVTLHYITKHAQIALARYEARYIKRARRKHAL